MLPFFEHTRGEERKIIIRERDDKTERMLLLGQDKGSRSGKGVKKKENEEHEDISSTVGWNMLANNIVCVYNIFEWDSSYFTRHWSTSTSNYIFRLCKFYFAAAFIVMYTEKWKHAAHSHQPFDENPISGELYRSKGKLLYDCWLNWSKEVHLHSNVTCDEKVRIKDREVAGPKCMFL